MKLRIHNYLLVFIVILLFQVLIDLFRNATSNKSFIINVGISILATLIIYGLVAISSKKKEVGH